MYIGPSIKWWVFRFCLLFGVVNFAHLNIKRRSKLTHISKLIKAHFDTDIKQLSLTFNILLCRSKAMEWREKFSSSLRTRITTSAARFYFLALLCLCFSISQFWNRIFPMHAPFRLKKSKETASILETRVYLYCY